MLLLTLMVYNSTTVPSRPRYQWQASYLASTTTDVLLQWPEVPRIIHDTYWVVGCWHGVLGWGADLHIAQQMPLPLTIFCSSKSRFGFNLPGFTFLVPAHPGGPGQIPGEQ